LKSKKLQPFEVGWILENFGKSRFSYRKLEQNH